MIERVAAEVAALREWKATATVHLERLPTLEQAVSEQRRELQSYAVALAKSNEARVHMLGHLEKLQTAATRATWGLISLLLGVIGTTAGWLLK